MLVVGSQSDQILSGGNTTRQRHCAELDDVSVLGARGTGTGVHTLQHTVIGGWISDVVGGAGDAYAGVGSPCVETHLFLATLYPLLPAFVDVCAGIAVSSQAVALWTGTQVATPGVAAVVLADVSTQLAFVYVNAGFPDASCTIALRALAAIATISVDAALVVVLTPMGVGCTLINVLTLAASRAHKATRTQLNTLIRPFIVDTFLVCLTPMASFIAFVDVSASPTPSQSVPRRTGTMVTARCVDTLMGTHAGWPLTLVHIHTAALVSQPEASVTGAAIASHQILTVLLTDPWSFHTLVDVFTLGAVL